MRFIVLAPSGRRAPGATTPVVWSAEEYMAAAGPGPRGMNSFQLYSDGTRWCIVTIFWDAETADKPIPTKYLPQ